MSSHPIVHVEIPASDPLSAGTFYADVFDWQVDTSMPEYPMFKVEGGPPGAFVSLATQPPDLAIKYEVGKPLLFIATDDINASLASVEAHGGKVAQPLTPIPSVGAWAAFTDPTGNLIGLFTRTEHEHS